MTQEVKTKEQLLAEAERAEQKARELRQQIAETENLTLRKRENEILERRAEEERRIQRQREEHELKLQRIHEQREKDRLVYEEAENKRKAEDLELQRIVAARETAAQEKKTLEERLRKASEQEFLLEQQLKQAEADLYRDGSHGAPVDDDSTLGVRNEDLAFPEESKDANRSTEGRKRIFTNRTEQGQEIDYNAVPVPVQTQAEAPYVFPAEYAVLPGGKLDPRVFAKLFTEANPFKLFVNGNAEVCSNGYKWRVEGSVNSRAFYHSAPCVIDQLPSGEYYLTTQVFVAGQKERVAISLVGIEPLFKPVALTPSELRGDTQIFQDDELVSE
jgi:hypothetical protein